MDGQQQIERKIGELHEYVRHIFQLFVGWFTFFATVNYASMGWLAKAPGSTSTSVGLVWVVSILFITQNLLGIVACFVVRRYLLERDLEVIELEKMVTPIDGSVTFKSSIPAALYSCSVGLMAGALVLILLSWFFIPVFFTMKI